ncbi:hypothetical protein [Nocardioides bizhenqiangii]|uniref:Uncharacterized protein n=1 Tax=Nocardioides bizhenqiangii TaxID=3095076 RepID=A0ABZ0ZQ61_9ACTN|nr:MULTISPECIES: hypothetical protein [unclassified Nocardioides]MDZ5619482.1 hypothetical protein [Nocardioides sp. HM23]WQQ26501.1 hypothetical protein SHK19_21410 [Nocardioides sp. HM61]
MRSVVRRAAAAVALALGLGTWAPFAAAVPVPAAEPVDLGGQPVVSSTDPREPTPLEPGLWTVSLGPESQAQFFTYERQIEDSTVHIGAIGAPAGPDGEGLELTATVAATEGTEPVDCGTDQSSTDSSAPYGLVGAQVIAGDEEDHTTNTPCRSADTVELRLARYSGYNSVDLPVAIKIVEEAPVSSAEEPPESEELDYQVPDPTDPASTPAGAPSFDEAPVVDAHDGPVTLDTTIAEGTELLWRVPLEWGDRLVARADLPGLPEGEAEELGSPSVYLKLAIIQPSRDAFVLTRDDDSSYGYYGTPEGSGLVAGTYPLRYTNRYSSDVDPVLPGDHWVSVTAAAAPEERAALDVPIQLTFQVTGSDATPPTYKGAVLAQGGGDGPEGYSPETPFLVGDGEFSAVASGNPFTPEGEDGEGWWGLRRGVGLGLGVVSLACCAAGGVWLTRRLSSRAATSR